jgi:hypothetical protein
MTPELISSFIRDLQAGIAGLPTHLAGLCGTFNFTRTGKNFCHPVIWGLITNAVEGLPGVRYIGIDVRLNEGDGLKFQPDVVGFEAGGKPILYVDFESPNSSDARIPIKDAKAYSHFVKKDGHPAPYVIVTSLPDCSSPEWELRWTNKGQYNFKHRGKKKEVWANPFRYWSTLWRKELSDQDLVNVTLVNIDRENVTEIQL